MGKAEEIKRLADEHFDREEFEQARPLYEQLVVLQRESSDPCYNLGACCEELGDSGGAFLAYFLATRRGPTNKDAQAALQEIAGKLQKRSSQGAWIRCLLELVELLKEKRSLNDYFVQVILLCAQGREVRLDGNKQGVMSRREFAQTMFDFGVIFLLNDASDCAISFFSCSIELNPEYAQAYGNRGVAYTKGPRTI